MESMGVITAETLKSTRRMGTSSWRGFWTQRSAMC
uniref:Uncharacterized protein n=1 Tax=Anguilla anguilla TaxID=7936 RepID=A0A0E9XZV0_ANGAN